MEFFYLTEKSSFKFTDKEKLTVEINLESYDNRLINTISPQQIYFTSDVLLPFLIEILKQNNKQNILNLLNVNEKIYPKFLEEKDIGKNKITGLKNNILLEKKKLLIAMIFDIKQAFSKDFTNSVTEGLNYFYKKLFNKIQDIQIDIFTIYLSEWMDLSASVPITNLNLIPETLNKLISYDAYIKFSDIVNNNNLIDKSAIDNCLQTLGVNLNQAENNDNIYYPFLVPNNDLVSIILGTYNRENYLSHAIESVLNQTYKNIELIIVNDGSTDNTKNIIDKYLPDKRVKYLYQDNKGICSARNKGIKNAQGKYLMFLDDDDFYLPYAVHKLLSFFIKQPENVKLVYGNVVYFNEKLKIYRNETKLPPKPNLYLQFLVGNKITTPGQVMLDMKAVREVGMFDETFIKSEDYELWTKIVLKYDIAKLDIAVIFYRLHEAQATKNRGKIRKFSDMTSFKYWYLLRARNYVQFDLSDLNTESDKNERMAQNIEGMAYKMLNYTFSHFDTGLELMKFAQEKQYNKERQNFIDYLTEDIPTLIREKYDCDLRISEEEKEILRSEIPRSKINII